MQKAMQMGNVNEMNIIINCPICGAEVTIDPQIHILDDFIRTEYCDCCEQIFEISNQKPICYN